MYPAARRPRVSIGLPVYNGERFIAEALDSLLRQTYQDFEIIVSDNASADRTEGICRSYAEKDGRIRYVRNAKNLGLARNYRRVFELSSGEYFKLAADDDLCAPDFLRRCIEVLDREPSVVLAYPRTKIISETGEVVSEYDEGFKLDSNSPSDRFRQLVRNIRLCNVSHGVGRARVMAQTGLLGDYAGADVNLMAELSLYGRFHEVPEFLFFRRLHPAASSGLKADAQLVAYLTPSMALSKRPPMTTWRRFAGYFVAVKRAPVNTRVKMDLLFFISHTAYWDRAKLAREFWGAMIQCLGKPGVWVVALLFSGFIR